MNQIPDWLLQKTFAVQHNPNCPSMFCVRLVGRGTGSLDYEIPSVTKDALGYGKTIEEAAENARSEQVISNLGRPQRGVFPQESYRIL